MIKFHDPRARVGVEIESYGLMLRCAISSAMRAIVTNLCPVCLW